MAIQSDGQPATAMFYLACLAGLLGLWVYRSFFTLPSLAKSPTTTICETCTKRCSQRCTICNQTSYCSKKCQRKDREKHKLMCNERKDYDETCRPISSDPDRQIYRRAIYFDDKKRSPQWVWVQMQKRKPRGEKKLQQYWLPTLADFGLADSGPKGAIFDSFADNKRTKRGIPKRVFVLSRATTVGDETIGKNEIAERLVAMDDDSDELPDWKGPMLFHGMLELEEMPEVLSCDLYVMPLHGQLV
jgi:hypothetical protein